MEIIKLVYSSFTRAYILVLFPHAHSLDRPTYPAAMSEPAIIAETITLLITGLSYD